MFLFIFILLSYNIFLSFDIEVVNLQTSILANMNWYILGNNYNLQETLCLILLIPASIKSAQFGAHI